MFSHVEIKGEKFWNGDRHQKPGGRKIDLRQDGKKVRFLEAKNFPEPQNKTKKISKQLKSVMEINTEAVTLLGHASQELSVRRRFQMQKHLPNDIASLSQIQVEPRSDTLFGFDIEKKMKDARESYRAKSYKFNRFKPYSSSYRGKNSKSFLGKDTFPQRGRYNSRRGSARRGYYPQRGFRK